jgi:hypothetical protein
MICSRGLVENSPSAWTPREALAIRVGESGREEGYLTLPDGLVMLGDDDVGVYTVFVDGTIRINLHNKADVEETLEHLAENGSGLTLLATPNIIEE